MAANKSNIGEPLVSVCLPTYNRPVTLERTLNSIINQTYKNIEIIISDNGSTNQDVKYVIEKFISDTRIKYYRQPVNKGPIFNFNFVLEKVTGEYFMKIADDDWLDTNYIEDCMAFLLNNPGYSSAYGIAKIYDTKGVFIGFDAKIDMVKNSPQLRIKNYLKNVDKNGCYYGLMHKSYLPYVTSKNYLAMDWLIVSRVAFLGKYKVLESTSSHILLGGDSYSTDHLTAAYNMSDFTKSFPYMSAGLNIMKDVLWKSNAYKNLGLFEKLKLAGHCYFIVFRRFGVRREIRPGVKKYIKLKAKPERLIQYNH